MSLDALRFRRMVEPALQGAVQPVGEDARPSASKRLAGLFSVALLLIVASPVVENWKSTQHDDFPLSYFRMFSEERADTQRVNYLVALDEQGGRFLIPYRYAGAGGMNQVRRQINKQVDDGKATNLCRTVATRVARAGNRLPDLRTVEITTGTFRMSEYFTGEQVPIAENVRARCTVEGSRS